MKYGLLGVGALLLLAGLTFTLQGAGVLPGSFMTGQAMWFWIGLTCLVIGIVAVVVGMRAGRKT
jgi:hypothetical protein